MRLSYGNINHFTNSEVGKSVLNALSNLNPMDHINYWAFNPINENDQFHWKYPEVFENPNNMIAIQCTGENHVVSDHWFPNGFMSLWLTESVYIHGFNDDRFKPYTVIDDISDYELINPDKKLETYLKKYVIKLYDVFIPIYIGTSKSDPIEFMIWDKSHTHDLIQIATAIYHPCEWIDDVIKEAVSSIIFEHMKFDPDSTETSIKDLMEGIYQELRDSINLELE